MSAAHQWRVSVARVKREARAVVQKNGHDAVYFAPRKSLPLGVKSITCQKCWKKGFCNEDEVTVDLGDLALPCTGVEQR